MDKKKRATIAILTGNNASEYLTELMAGFRACAKEEDVNLVFLMGPHIPGHCREMLNSSFSWNYEYQFHYIYEYVQMMRPDAIIIEYGSMCHYKHIPPVEVIVDRCRPIPTLLMTDKVSDPDVPYLVAGNYDGMKENLLHLVEDHGYKKIAFMAGPRNNFDSGMRLQAYRDVLTEHNIPIDEGMIVYGDYSEVVEKEVNYLLDTYPDLEAMVFANDDMAKGAYRVCMARDLVVGKDIAIAGFDDSDICKTLEPTLTSVAHSSFMFSYTAVQAALELCKGKKPESKQMPAFFRKRCSCGCQARGKEIGGIHTQQELREYLNHQAEFIADELFSAIPYSKDKQDYSYWMKHFFHCVQREIFEYREEGDDTSLSLYQCLKKLCRNTFISVHILLEYIENEINALEPFLNNREHWRRQVSVLKGVRQHLHAQELSVLYKENSNAEKKMWFQPSFITDLINIKMEPRDQMAYIMGRLKAMDVKSAYLFFNKEVVCQAPGERLKCGDELYVVAYFDGENIVAFSEEEMPTVGKEEGGILSVLPEDSARFYTAYTLFAGAEQYGILLCEVEYEDYSFMLSCSMQLGALRRIINMNLSERRMKAELQEKNHILSEISMFDSLSKLLNRRGFVEKALRFLNKNRSRKACMLFADIDHLKEINDCYGHGAGDFAITTSAEYLRECMPKGAIIARLGGDEYVALFALEANSSSQSVTDKIKSYMKNFNENCDRPFVVEMSVGAYDFVCNSNTDISELLKKSDELLYEQKRNRRDTVKKG